MWNILLFIGHHIIKPRDDKSTMVNILNTFNKTFCVINRWWEMISLTINHVPCVGIIYYSNQKCLKLLHVSINFKYITGWSQDKQAVCDQVTFTQKIRICVENKNKMKRRLKTLMSSTPDCGKNVPIYMTINRDMTKRVITWQYYNSQTFLWTKPSLAIYLFFHF